MLLRDECDCRHVFLSPKEEKFEPCGIARFEKNSLFGGQLLEAQKRRNFMTDV